MATVFKPVPGTWLFWTNTVSGVEFWWPGNFRLQYQTHGSGAGLDASWTDYPGGGASPVTVPMDTAQETVFFRLFSNP